MNTLSRVWGTWSLLRPGHNFTAEDTLLVAHLVVQHA